MRVHANRDSALVLAAQASKAVPKITTIPELKGIHMEADARLAMLTMTATNQEVSIRASMPAAVEESGSAVIPADLLPDILKRLPGDQVSFSTVGPGIIHIGSGYAEYRLNILDAAKYPLPEVPFLEDTIPVSGICSLARQTLFAAAAGDQQNILKTVRLKVGPYGLKATSSNGFCIAEAAGDKNCVAASETCILVPARSLSILAAISLDSDVYQMGLTREGLAFWNGTTMFCTHLIDGSYRKAAELLEESVEVRVSHYIYETESPGPDAHAEQSHFDLLDAYNELARRHRRSRFEHREDVSKVRTFSLHLEL